MKHTLLDVDVLVIVAISAHAVIDPSVYQDDLFTIKYDKYIHTL